MRNVKYSEAVLEDLVALDLAPPRDISRIRPEAVALADRYFAHVSDSDETRNTYPMWRYVG